MRTDMYTKSHNVLTFLKNVDASQIYTFKQHLDSLISVTKAIGSISRLDELLERILYYALAVTGAERGFLFLYSQINETLKLEVMRGVKEELRKDDYSFETYRVSREIINVAKKAGRPILGAQEDSDRTKGFSGLKHYGIQQALCVPFQVRKKTLGFLYIDHTFDRALFREQEIELMRSFAALISLSIENTYLNQTFEKQGLKNISIPIEPSPYVPDLNIIAIKGVLDTDTIRHADRKILPVLELEPNNFIIDLTKVTCLDKQGILCLTKYLIMITSEKRALKFIRPPQHIYRTFEIIGIVKKFNMYGNIGEAVSTFS
jgi:anti-anti-sigma regulatory factor